MAALASFIYAHSLLLIIIIVLTILLVLNIKIFRTRWPNATHGISWLLSLALSIALGICGGIASHYIGLSDAFPGADGLVADVVAGSITTGFSICVITIFVQTPIIGAQVITSVHGGIQESLIGINDDNMRDAIQAAVLAGAVKRVPNFSVKNKEYPLVLVNDDSVHIYPADATSSSSEAVIEIALGLELGQHCPADKLYDAVDILTKRFDKKFSFVLLIDNARTANGANPKIVGIACAKDLFKVLFRYAHDSPSRVIRSSEPSLGVARAIAERVEHYDIGTAQETLEAAFEPFGFIVKALKEPKNVARMIAEMIAAERNTALLMRHGAVAGVASLHRMIEITHRF